MLKEIPKEKLISFLSTLKTIYAVKAAIKTLFQSCSLKSVKGISYGEEAVSTGICEALNESDVLLNTYDCISNLVSRGGSLNNIFAEILGRKDGCNKGLRGCLNISIPEKNIYCANSMSDTQAAMATGFAMAFKIKCEKNVAAVFYNNETANEGVIHESMNIASAFKLPVLFICLDRINTDEKPDADNMNFYSRSIGYDIKGYSIDGTDVCEVYSMTKQLIAEIRETNIPAVIQCSFPYYFEDFNEIDIKKKTIVKKAVLDNFVKMIQKNKILSLDEINRIEEDARIIAEEAIKFGKSSEAPVFDLIRESMYSQYYNISSKSGGLL